MDRILRIGLLLFLISLSFATRQRSDGLQSSPTLTILDRNGNPTSQIVDGNLIQIRLVNLESPAATSAIDFYLQGSVQPVASCSVEPEKGHCESQLFESTGWHWGVDGSPQPDRMLDARLPDGQVLASTFVQVNARPVVMVHGFSSNYTAWTHYLGPQGYLAQIGVPGFAVGDEQAPGIMNTGQFSNPLGRTNTIAQNAAILGEYLAGVKRETGAEQVDLLAHSMGGMISRYYIDRLMAVRDVSQLLMLGSPSLGTACANLPASLGYYLPATLEIQPEYAIRIFNPQITHRRGVPFYILAGDPIANPAGSPCTDVPSDLVISHQSATGIPLLSSVLPILHTDLNTSEEAFTNFVRPLLQKGPGEYMDEPDPAILPAPADLLQFGRVYSGHLEAGQSEEIVIPIEAGVQVASFGLFDPSRSLMVVVRGASGNVIELNADNNGLIEVDDPQSLIYLGYGFNEPRPGIWNVTLMSSDQTPSGGTDYALAGRFVGGAKIEATSLPILPVPGEQVVFQVSMSLNGLSLDIQQATGLINDPGRQVELLDLRPEGDGYRASWEAKDPGLYGVDFLVTGTTPEGIEVQRSASLVLEVQPPIAQPRSRIMLILLVVAFMLCLAVIIWAFRLFMRKIMK